MVVVAGSGAVGAAVADLLGSLGRRRGPPENPRAGAGAAPAVSSVPTSRRRSLRPRSWCWPTRTPETGSWRPPLPSTSSPTCRWPPASPERWSDPLSSPDASACLTCLDRIRQDADPGWPAVADGSRTDVPGPSPVLAASAAALAAEQVLDHLDAIDRPTSVDATLEWQTGGQRARRRSWYQHPECGCRQLTTLTGAGEARQMARIHCRCCDPIKARRRLVGQTTAVDHQALPDWGGVGHPEGRPEPDRPAGHAAAVGGRPGHAGLGSAARRQGSRRRSPRICSAAPRSSSSTSSAPSRAAR